MKHNGTFLKKIQQCLPSLQYTTVFSLAYLLPQKLIGCFKDNSYFGGLAVDLNVKDGNPDTLKV